MLARHFAHTLEMVWPRFVSLSFYREWPIEIFLTIFSRFSYDRCVYWPYAYLWMAWKYYCISFFNWYELVDVRYYNFYNIISLQMERNAAAGRTPSSLPLSTPPPASLSSSPDFGALSPVHTNSLTEAKSLNVKPEPTNFTLPPSYTEDNRIITSRGPTPDYSLGDQRNDKYISGGKMILLFELSFCFVHTMFSHWIW